MSQYSNEMPAQNSSQLPEELESFFNCLGKTVTDYEAEYEGYQVLVQGTMINNYYTNNRAIAIYPNIHSDYYSSVPIFSGEEIEMVEIPDTPENHKAMKKRCADITIPKLNAISRVYYYKKADSKYTDGRRNINIAKVDTNGNIFFMDFYHENFAPFNSVFEWILNHHYKKKYHLPSMEKITNQLQGISADIVTKITIEGGFDKEKYIEEATSIINAKISGFKELKDRQVKMLRESLKRQLVEVQTLTKQARREGFVQGIKVKSNGWKISGDRLVYTEKIPCTQLKNRGKIVKLTDTEDPEYWIEGLSVEIGKTVAGFSSAVSSSSRHPNCNSERICIGTLEGVGLEDFLTKAPTTLRLGNLDSPLNRILSDKAREKHFYRNTESASEVPGRAFITSLPDHELWVNRI
jgi:hypothetical protein